MGKRPAVDKSERSQKKLQRSVLQFITTYVTEHGYSPSMREIGEQCHIGRATVGSYLDRLEIEGYLRRDIGVARGITLLKPPPTD